MPITNQGTNVIILIETQYIPTIAFYSLLYKSDVMLIDKHENYHKGSFRNRCEILSSQGRISLSVPLQSGKNNQLPIEEVRINNEENWQVNHLRSIKSCYGKSPYYEYYYPIVEEILSKEYEFLFQLNQIFIERFAKVLDIQGKISFTEIFRSESNSSIQLKRDFISPKARLRQQIDSEIELKPYDQVFSDELEFESNLSILDLIFCLGPEAILYLSRSIKRV
jgi:hypothetical protein